MEVSFSNSPDILIRFSHSYAKGIVNKLYKDDYALVSEFLHASFSLVLSGGKTAVLEF